MSTTPERPSELPFYLSGDGKRMWIRGRDDGLHGSPMPPTMSREYVFGYRAAERYADSCRGHCAANRPLENAPGSVNDQYPALYLRVLEIEKRLANASLIAGSNGITDAVRKLSSRVSEMEQMITSLTDPSDDKPAPQIIRLGGIGTSPAYDLRSLAAGLNAFALAFGDYKQSEQSIIPGISEEIQIMAERISSMAKACDKAWPNPAAK